jgi:hypothetical protein
MARELYGPNRKIALRRRVRFDNASTFLEMIPCPAALWSRDRSFYLLNESAKSLIRFSKKDLLNRPSFWTERIHPADQQKFLRSQKELAKGESSASCDYRFFPKGAAQPIWIRDFSVLGKQEGMVPWDVISTYIEVSDLKAVVSTENNEGATRTIIERLVHDLKNGLHTATMGLELAKAGVNEHADVSRLLVGMHSMRDSLQDLQDCILPVERSRGCRDPAALLDMVLRDARREVEPHQINLQLVRREPLPMVRGDPERLRSALERVVRYCGHNVRDGGDLAVEAGPKKIGEDLYAEVKITPSSSVSIEFDEKKEFQPYLEIENERIELGMALAAEILRRYQGRVSVRRQSTRKGQVTILMKALRS